MYLFIFLEECVYYNLSSRNPLKCLCSVFLTARHGETIFQGSATNYMNLNEVLAHFNLLKEPTALNPPSVKSFLDTQ